jgi:hypothetical protein
MLRNELRRIIQNLGYAPQATDIVHGLVTETIPVRRIKMNNSAGRTAIAGSMNTPHFEDLRRKR